jgi:hypothetical protein
MYEPQSQDRNLPIDLPLYRIAPEVTKEILSAVDFWQKFSPVKNTLLVNRAITNLTQPYSTTNVTISNSANSQSNDNKQAIDKVKNGINAFKQYLQSEKNKATSQETIKLISDMMDTLSIAVESVIKDI